MEAHFSLLNNMTWQYTVKWMNMFQKKEYINGSNDRREDVTLLVSETASPQLKKFAYIWSTSSMLPGMSTSVPVPPVEKQPYSMTCYKQLQVCIVSGMELPELLGCIWFVPTPWFGVRPKALKMASLKIQTDSV